MLNEADCNYICRFFRKVPFSLQVPVNLSISQLPSHQSVNPEYLESGQRLHSGDNTSLPHEIKSIAIENELSDNCNRNIQ